MLDFEFFRNGDKSLLRIWQTVNFQDFWKTNKVGSGVPCCDCGTNWANVVSYNRKFSWFKLEETIVLDVVNGDATHYPSLHCGACGADMMEMIK